MPDVVERLKRDFRDPDYRHIYDEGFLSSSIATQIKVLREQREWTQAKLADQANMNQSRISEIEDVNFNCWTIRTLRRLARAFDLRLKISFEEFGTLLEDFRNLNRQSLGRASFGQDLAFKASGQGSEPEKIARKVEDAGMEQAALRQRGELIPFQDIFQGLRGGQLTQQGRTAKQPEMELCHATGSRAGLAGMQAGAR